MRACRWNVVDQSYVDSIENWRKERAVKISAPHGWLATAGLFWLQEGINRMGADQSNPILLPNGSGPGLAGVFKLKGGEVSLDAADGVAFRLGDALISKTPIPIEDETSQPLFLNDLKIFVLQRGRRFGVRIFDPHNPALRDFGGLNWYPIDEDYQVTARFISLPETQTIKIITVLGDQVEMPFPGTIEFSLQGKPFSLDPVGLDDGRLWLMFRDATNGSQTYPAGRYLVTDAPQGGTVVLDFNKAYNPPCAYTDFATCPLPPGNNRLKLEISAGEKRYRG